ncbi:hypothetical protein [Desulfogranum marinum]|uniref:hypothetical protein n=1 Tax=Desulfogranum marinum TaxID=453220 RepID=UPI001962C750|nr:hypothetical protein [Desulfogranum marinum]MBM9512949.1 hypothetical protein [Desulfogranum marinum]
MKYRTRCFLVAHLLAVVLLVAGCAHNKLTDSWINAEYRGKLKGPVFIMGVFTNPTAHKIFEDNFVEEFGKIGIKAIPSYAFNFGTDQVNKKTLQQTLHTTGAREVLIIHLTNESTSSYQFPEKDYAWAGAVSWQAGYGYYSTIYADVWADDREIDKTIDVMEATLLDAEKGTRIWSAKMHSVNLNKFVRTNDEQLEELFLKDMAPLFYKVRN